MAYQYFELKYEYEDGHGWHAMNGHNLGAGSNEWWRLPAALKMDYADYVCVLIEQFKPDYIHWNEERNVLSFAWKKQMDMRKFRNWANKRFREVHPNVS